MNILIRIRKRENGKNSDRVKKSNHQMDWDQFHTPENLAKSISIEAGELLECFQWNDDYDFDKGAVAKVSELTHDKISVGMNWPVVYVINNDKEAYVGETVNVSLHFSIAFNW